MKKRAIHLCLAGFLAIAAGPAAAATLFAPPPALNSAVVQVAASCSAVGQRIAASKGGTLVRASPTQNGQSCIIVIVVPAKDGQRTRRVEMTVPAQ